VRQRLAIICLALTFVACGSAESGQSVGEPDAKPKPLPRGPTVRMSKAEIAKLPPLKTYRLSGPPPKHLEIIDLRKGSGPGVPQHDWVTNREEVFYRDIEALSYRKAREGRYIGPYLPAGSCSNTATGAWRSASRG
jgi:hypothetical protein